MLWNLLQSFLITFFLRPCFKIVLHTNPNSFSNAFLQKLLTDSFIPHLISITEMFSVAILKSKPFDNSSTNSSTVTISEKFSCVLLWCCCFLLLIICYHCLDFCLFFVIIVFDKFHLNVNIFEPFNTYFSFMSN